MPSILALDFLLLDCLATHEGTASHDHFEEKVDYTLIRSDESLQKQLEEALKVVNTSQNKSRDRHLTIAAFVWA